MGGLLSCGKLDKERESTEFLVFWVSLFTLRNGEAFHRWTCSLPDEYVHAAYFAETYRYRIPQMIRDSENAKERANLELLLKALSYRTDYTSIFIPSPP